MLETNFRQISKSVPPSSRTPRRLEIEALHGRCGVYTKPEIVARILDKVGWRDSSKLFQYRLLEPAAGNGEFVVEAARRLVTACRKGGLKPNAKLLRNCIRAFEIHPREAQMARRRLKDALEQMGLHTRTVNVLARSWIATADFLLTTQLASNFTHAVGNPPYVRWSKIPAGLQETYRRALPSKLVGGDIFVPFLDRSLGSLVVGGKCGFLCSDRWRYAAFAEAFRSKWLPRLEIASEEELLAIDAFEKDVDTYPAILIAKIRKVGKKLLGAPVIHLEKTLVEHGYTIKVGPALGCTSAYVLRPEETDVEAGLLHPWVDGSEITEGNISWRGRRIAAMHDNDGSLIEPRLFPLLDKRLQRFKSDLEKRSIVKNGARWFQPIDRVRASDWAMPKLLIPEIAKIPRIAIDYSGAIPSHGVYAIFAPGQKIDTLYDQLADGGLARALEGIAPRIKGGYVRCYKRFLAQIRLRSS
jgi:hypothetical protein